MSSFEDLALGPDVVEALTAEGFESPSSFQEDAIPVVGRGNNLVGRAGPGAGVLLSYGAPLLDRLDLDAGSPGAVVLVPTRNRAGTLALRLARLAVRTGHRIAALGGRWALPQTAHVLFGTPADVLGAVRDSTLKLESVTAVIVDGAAQIRGLEGLDSVETVLGLVPDDAQKIVLSLPFPDDLEGFVERHVRRPARVPSKGTLEADERAEAPRRGTLRHRIAEGDRLEATLAAAQLRQGDMDAAKATLAAVGDLLGEGSEAEAEHVLIHFHSDDEAADVGDALTLHGYVAGAPGDPAVPVWLGTEGMESRRVLDSLEEPERVATLSHRVPLDADALDLRHGRGGAAMVLLTGAEVPHLESCARIAGYQLDAFPDSIPPEPAAEVAAFRSRIEEALGSADVPSYLLLLEPLLRDHGAARIAAAVTALLRSRRAEGSEPSEGTARGITRDGGSQGEEPPRAWVRLFISIGSRDDAGPGDLLGAITGEAQIPGSQVGRIDIQDTHSIVEVDQRVARSVIEAMNGITVKGRSLRVDYDRPRSGKGRKEGSSGSRKRGKGLGQPGEKVGPGGQREGKEKRPRPVPGAAALCSGWS